MDDWSDSTDDEDVFADEGFWDDDSVELLPCPKCGAEIYEESQQCPSCGNYIIHDKSSWRGRPVWWLILGLCGIGAVIVLLSLAY